MNPYKKDFPIFETRTGIAYLDNAATSFKPQVVLDTISHYYQNTTANPHRGAYALSNDATQAYENARTAVAKFLNAQYEEVVFTAGTTESMHLVALSYGLNFLKKGDEIALCISEHHSNLLPWQFVAEKTGATLVYLDTDENGRLVKQEWEKKITNNTKLVAVAQVSNVMGRVQPIAEIAKFAHEKGAVIVVDGAQSVPHMKVDVKALDVDFFAFSGHKAVGPAGIGVLYGKKELLDKMPPAILGGGIVEDVQKFSVRYLDTPTKFEAGTPNTEGAVGLQAALEYLDQVGFDNIEKIDKELMEYAMEQFAQIPHLTIYGGTDPSDKAGIIAFNVDDVHPHDVATVLDSFGVCIRAGHHCAQPLMSHLGTHSTCRMSLFFYNTKEDITRIVEALKKVREVVGL